MARKKLTEERFFEECDQAHGAYFGDLMARWHEVGHRIRMQASSAALVIGNTTLCFLYPSYRNQGGAVRISVTSLGLAFGKKWAESLAEDVRAIEGLQTGSGRKEIIVRRPAEASLDPQEALKQLMLGRG
ncbi:MAG: hypothetical protein KAS81_06630 [Anaerolineales bacterium]|nr:hypothetical protein [Anaerolineales bacterium]